MTRDEVDVELIKNSKGFWIFILILGFVFVLSMSYFFTSSIIKGSKLRTECTQSVTGEAYTYPSTGRNSSLFDQQVGARYGVDGVVYHAKGIDVVRHYPGDTVTVHYNPDNPTEAFAGNEPYHWPYVMELLCIFCGVMMIIAGIKMLRNL